MISEYNVERAYSRSRRAGTRTWLELSIDERAALVEFTMEIFESIRGGEVF